MERQHWPCLENSNIAVQFKRTADANPTVTAVADKEKILSYRELDSITDIIAANLIRRGLKPGDGAAFCLNRSWKTTALILGILKAGGHYIPIDSLSPLPRILSMIAVGKPAFLVVDGAGLPSSAGKQFHFASLLAGAPGGFSPPEIGGATPAYINFTSGSTGTPKAVVIPHVAVLSLACGVSYLDLPAGFAFLNMSNIAFDASTFEIFVPLLNGGTCVMYRENVPEVKTLPAFLEEKKVTHAWMTSSLFNWVVETDAEALRGLKELWIGGDVVSGKHVDMAYKACPDLQLVNGYGPTECTTFSLCYKIPRPVDLSENVPIGLPIDRTICLVVDERLDPVPEGEVGELLLGGPRLALGYKGDVESTSKYFVELASPADGARIRYFKTGDKVRVAKGLYDFIGRKDNLVKLRGFRIELEEIEAALRRHPGILGAFVKKQVSPKGEYLAAFISSAAQPPSDEQIKGRLRESLPEYMVPSVIVRLEKFPLNANGKTDRELLDVPPAAALSAGPEPAQGAGGMEALCLALIKEISGVSLNPADGFQDSGIQSLHLAGLADKLSRSTGLALPIDFVFRHPNVRSMADEITKMKEREII